MSPCPKACWSAHKAMVWEANRQGQLSGGIPYSIREITLRCHLLEGHAGNHQTKLPKEALEDAGKHFEWPA